MNEHYLPLIEILEKENRYMALSYVRDLVENKGLLIVEIYEELLAPTLNHMVPSGSENIDILNEHKRTSIIKTIIENMYPYVVAEREAKGIRIDKTVAVMCPPDEYHDVGARMVSDILTIQGYETIFVGANTPWKVFETVLEQEAIDLVAISISNPYHLVSTRKIIEGIRKMRPQIQVIVGGHAITKIEDPIRTLDADFAFTSLSDISKMKGGHIDGLIL